jgi:acyl carrier protein
MEKTLNYQDLKKDDDVSFIVKDIIQYKLGLEENQLPETAQFHDDLGVDSLDLIELHMEIEKKFGIKISEEYSENLLTVGSLIKFVRENR